MIYSNSHDELFCNFVDERMVEKPTKGRRTQKFTVCLPCADLSRGQPTLLLLLLLLL